MSRRMRLSDVESAMIDQWRNTGILPQQNILTSDNSVMKMQSSSKEIKQRYKDALVQIEEYREKVDLILKLSDEKEIKHKYKRKKVSESSSIAIGVASDWHVDERIEPETLNGRNAFNKEIAVERIDNFWKNLLFLIEKERNATDINQLVLALLGDFISGYIHLELIENNTMSPLEAILFVQAKLKGGIDFLLNEGEFDKIYAICAFGNHGRLSDKTLVSTGYKNNLEWMMYHTLKNMYEGNDRIEFSITNGYHNYMTLFGKYRLRFHHGDAMKYSGAIGGINASVQRTIAKWESYENEKIYLDVFGHHHGRQDGGNYLVNGSLAGYTCYAKSIKAKFEKPSQEFFLVEEEHGKTTVAPIFVE